MPKTISVLPLARICWCGLDLHIAETHVESVGRQVVKTAHAKPRRTWHAETSSAENALFAVLSSTLSAGIPRQSMGFAFSANIEAHVETEIDPAFLELLDLRSHAHPVGRVWVYRGLSITVTRQGDLFFVCDMSCRAVGGCTISSFPSTVDD